MATKIYINTDLKDLTANAVANKNRPTQVVRLPQIVEGETLDVELSLVNSNGGYDTRSGDSGVSLAVAVSAKGAVATSGTFTLTAGTETTAAIPYNASAEALQTALNDLNSKTGPYGSTVTVTKLSLGSYRVIFDTVGARTIFGGTSIDLAPESEVVAATAVVGSATIRAQIIIEISQQPAIYTTTWTTGSNKFSGQLDANTARVQELIATGQDAFFEVKVDDDVICQVPIAVLPAVAAPNSLPAHTIPSNLNDFAADPSTNGSFSVTNWLADLLAPHTKAVWGYITGTLSDQTDLQSALDDKAPIASPKFTGDVGIGATSPRSKLDVNGSIISNTTLAVEGMGDSNTSGPATEIQYRASDGAGRFYAYDRSTSTYKHVSLGDDLVYIENTGDVGIGVTSPENKLHVVDTSTGNITYPIRIQNDTIGDNSGVGIEFGISTSDNYTNARIQAIREDTAASAALTFLTRFDANSNLIERMRIDRSGNVSIYGDIKVLGEVQNLYNKEFAANTISGDSYNYYFDSFTGTRNLNGHIKNSKSDLIRYRPIDNYEYWDGSAWVADSSKISEVEKLLDGRQDTRYDVPARDLKFRFTTSPTTSYPTAAKVGMQTTWSGSDYQGARMTVEEYDGTTWNTRVLAKFGGSNTPLETTDNGCDQWGLAFISTNKLHTGIGSAANATRITVDFYGWTPSNSSYTVIPLQSLFITTNYSGLENTDYSNLLDYNRNISAPSDLSVAGTTTAPTIVASLIKGVGNDTGTAQPINYDAKEHRFRDFDGATDFPKNMLVVQKFDGYTGARVGINKDPASDNNVALHIVAGKNSNTNVRDLGLKVIGGAFFENYIRVGHYTNSTLVTAPNNGNIVYNTDENKFQGYQAGSGWGSFVTNEPDDSTSINSIRQVDQNTYDNLTPDANTVYIIVG